VDPKSIALTTTVRTEFRTHRSDQIEIDNAKANAVRALSNYLLATSARKDPKLNNAMKDFHGRSVKEAKDHEREQKQQ
jgi:hypothetical protein